MSGLYSRNKLFNTVYQRGAQDLPELETEVYVDYATESTIFESYEDYLTDVADGWAEFIKDFYE